jgi:CelD/BcsL family acetyltransferase involved in cellulose biosynthesis
MNVTVLDPPRQQQHTAFTSFKIEVLDGGKFAECDWPAITDGRDLKMYVFQSREFLETWTNTIGKAKGIKSYLLVVRNGGGEPVLYLPLAIETTFNIRILRFMDCGVADYNAPILKAGVALSRQEFKSLWAEALSLLPGFDVIDLKKIAGDVSGAVNPLAFLDCTSHGEDGHSLPLKGADAAADGGASISLRRKLDREHRKIGELGAVEFVVNPSGDLAELVTEKLFALKREKYAQTKVRDFLALPGVADFYREVISSKQCGKIGHLSALFIGETIVSAHIGYTGRGSFYYILPAYDTAYARYRPGHLLLRELVDRSAQQGDETFDFGVGDEPYKQTWANHRLPLYDHERAMTAAGQVYLQMRRVRRLVKSNSVRTWFRRAG